MNGVLQVIDIAANCGETGATASFFKKSFLSLNQRAVGVTFYQTKLARAVRYSSIAAHG
jgi:hypothetical protein